MDKARFASVDDYIAAQPAAAQRALKKVRAAARKALPDAVEGISYGMPAFKVQGRVAIYYAAWKQHYAIYPASNRFPEDLMGALSGYELSKGTIRFPLSEPVPSELITRIAAWRKEELSKQPVRGRKPL